MKRSIKSCIAFIATAAITGKDEFVLYDCGKEQRVHVSGTVKDGEVDIHHAKKGYHITGRLPSLSDPDNNIKIELEIDGNKFQGKEKKNGTRFKGKLKDDHISLTANGYCSYRIE